MSRGAWEVFELGSYVATVLDVATEAAAVELVSRADPGVEPGDCVAIRVEVRNGQTFREWLEARGKNRDPGFYWHLRNEWARA